ncbi:MAG: hypothetical protein CM15mP93_02040 [Thiotrichaceae bacterium]|nr:MAG: hypothetical protein CM15mP93_02040 [Thiotrichaceae bacterium]
MDIRKKIFNFNFIIIIIISLCNYSYSEVVDQALVIVEDDVITDREFALKTVRCDSIQTIWTRV